MGHTPSCGRRVVAPQRSHRTRKEVTRASRYQGTAYSATVELVPEGPGAPLGHRRLRLLWDLPQDVLQVVEALRHERVGPAQSRGSLPAPPPPPPAGGHADGPPPPSVAPADGVRPPAPHVVPPAHGPPGRPERLRDPPGPPTGGAAHEAPDAPQAPAALRHAPAGRLRPGGHQGPSRTASRAGRSTRSTGLDDCTRLRVVQFFPELTNSAGLAFLRTLRQAFPFRLRMVQTDNDATFTNWDHGRAEDGRRPGSPAPPVHPRLRGGGDDPPLHPPPEPPPEREDRAEPSDRHGGVLPGPAVSDLRRAREGPPAVQPVLQHNPATRSSRRPDPLGAAPAVRALPRPAAAGPVSGVTDGAGAPEIAARQRRGGPRDVLPLFDRITKIKKPP